MTPPDETGRVLVFRHGQLGDMIVSLPAMWVVRRQWPQARLTLLCDVHPGRKFVLGSEVFRNAGLFDAIEHYEVPGEQEGALRKALRRLRLLLWLRSRRYGAVVYLAPSIRKPGQVRRDVRYFRWAGARRIYGAGVFPPVPMKQPGQPFRAAGHEADLLLARLAADGLPVPAPGQGSLDLGIGEAEADAVRNWLSPQPADGGRPWLGVGPGSKMPAKRWPLERFGSVMQALVEKHDVWPVVFGGAEDRAAGDQLLAACGRGHNAAGQLSVRASASALRRCALYLGNDTGTMHLAAAARVPCVGVFSARDWPGAWYPYGVEQRIFRTAIECEGCYLEVCAERKNECLNRISVEQVLAGCESLLQSTRPSTRKTVSLGVNL